MLNITMTLSRCRRLKVYHNVLRDLEIEMKWNRNEMHSLLGDSFIIKEDFDALLK